MSHPTDTKSPRSKPTDHKPQAHDPKSAQKSLTQAPKGPEVQDSNPTDSSGLEPAKTQKKNRAQGAIRKSSGYGLNLLQCSWSFWYCKKANKQTNFETTLMKLGTAASVEEFWSFYSHLKRPDELASNSNLHLFRGTTMPMWENFPNGGNWVIRLKKNCALLSRMWEELLIACVGENFEEPDVVGVVISIRSKEDALYVWNANHNLRIVIGEKLKSILHLDPNCPMEYRTNRFNMESRLSPVINEEGEYTEYPEHTQVPENKEKAN